MGIDERGCFLGWRPRSAPKKAAAPFVDLVRASELTDLLLRLPFPCRLITAMPAAIPSSMSGWAPSTWLDELWPLSRPNGSTSLRLGPPVMIEWAEGRSGRQGA